MPFIARWIHKFQIKSGAWIFIPSEESVDYGNYVKEAIAARWGCPSYYFHLKDGGHVKALRSHLDKSYFARLDIEDFFGCVNKSKIIRCLKSYFLYADAKEIAIASTVLHPDKELAQYVLPFGFVQSPIIASMCLNKSKLGSVLDEIHHTKDYVLSVYMDDIIVSGDDRDHIIEILKDIKASAVRSRFFLNPRKEQGPSEKITAFNIELSHNLLEITKNRMKMFETAYIQAESHDQREGIIGYISSVNRSQAEELLK